MTILSILRERLVGKIITIFQSKRNPEYFFFGKQPESSPISVFITEVKYVEPYGEWEQEGGDYYKVFFEEGSAILDR